MYPFGYHPVKHKPIMWIHDNPKNICSLVVNNFCVLYYSVEYADHFFNELKAKYFITIDTGEKVYIEINLDWEYENRTVTFSMQNYVRKALHKFQHIMVGGKEYPPYICSPIQYGQKSNMQTLWMYHITYQKKTPTSFNKFVELSYIMPSLLTTLFSLLSVPFPRNSPRPQRT